MPNEINLEKFFKITSGKGLKMSSRRYRQLADEAKVPRVEKGNIDALESLIAIAVYYQALAEGSGSLTLTDERTRLIRIQADKKQLELDLARGDIIHTDTAMTLWGDVVMNTRAKLLAIPTKLAPLIAVSASMPETKDILDRYIKEVLNDLANPDLTMPKKEAEDPARPKKAVKGKKQKKAPEIIPETPKGKEKKAAKKKSIKKAVKKAKS